MDNFSEVRFIHALHVAHSHSIFSVHRLLKQYRSAERAWRASRPPGLDVQLEWDKLHELYGGDAIQLLTPDDRRYSLLLGEIAQPPRLLYARGNVELLNAPRLVSMVGTRRCTRYGRQVVADAVRELVAAGVVTVSGLALGIDSAVHAETVARGGKTIAVLGSSCASGEIAPPSNQRLADEILESGGLLVSEYPPGSRVYPSFFPERNRIIAGLSAATVVVEAAHKSGALITARFALDCNREVFTVPGSIYSDQSAGTNAFIESGAHPFLSCRSLFDALEYQMNFKTKANNHGVILTDEENAVLALFTREPLGIDDAIASSALPANDVLRISSLLVLKGLLRDMGNQQFIQQ
ncbi:MAG: DNA-processing protein DprA [Candidatus Kerfeldbacteria bacterium]